MTDARDSCCVAHDDWFKCGNRLVILTLPALFATTAAAAAAAPLPYITLDTWLAPASTPPQALPPVASKLSPQPQPPGWSVSTTLLQSKFCPYLPTPFLSTTATPCSTSMTSRPMFCPTSPPSSPTPATHPSASPCSLTNGTPSSTFCARHVSKPALTTPSCATCSSCWPPRASAPPLPCISGNFPRILPPNPCATSDAALTLNQFPLCLLPAPTRSHTRWCCH